MDECRSRQFQELARVLSASASSFDAVLFSRSGSGSVSSNAELFVQRSELMQIPTVQGLIDRRILANFRVEPEALAAILPRPFRPQLVQDYGIAGVCLIRLRDVRPKRLPVFPGIASENAAHRIAVEWDSDEGFRSGVFIPRRDTSSRLNVFMGGRIFPGVHHHARFEVDEDSEHFRIDMRSHDSSAHVLVDGHSTLEFPTDSIFPSVEAVSEFFESGSVGYSPGRSSKSFDGLELRTANWNVEPLSINQVESSFFDDRSVFPEGSVTFDNALLMRGIDHEWHSREPIHSLPAIC